MELTTDEKNVASALRLSAPATEKLLAVIQLNIEAAKEEMKRVSIPPAYVEADGALIQNAIVDYCLSRMGGIETRKDYQDAFDYQIDCIRKSHRTTQEAQCEE